MTGLSARVTASVLPADALEVFATRTALLRTDTRGQTGAGQFPAYRS
jgi:hypothetical protein